MSEISEFRDEMREILLGMDKRFDSMDKRMDSMDTRFDAIDKRLDSVDNRLNSIDKRLDSMEKENIENTQAICDLICENDKKYCERFDRIEKRLDNVESICQERWIVPDIVNRLDAVEKVVTKHTEQINSLLPA